MATLFKPGLDDSNITLGTGAATPGDINFKVNASAPTVGAIANNSGYIATTGNNAPQYGFIGGTKYQLDANGQPIGYTKPTETPQQVGVLTSDLAKADTNNLQNDINRRNQELIEQQRSNLSLTNANEIAGIIQAYDIHQRQLGEQQGEESLINRATQFRLGREATPYADSATQKLNQLHTDQINELTGQRQTLISKANAAMQAGNIELAKQLIDADQKALDRQDKLRQQQAEQKSRDIADRIAQATLESKETETLAKTVAPTLFASLTGDSTEDSKTIMDYAQKNGINPTTLYSTLLNYKSEREKEGMLNAKSTIDLLQTVGASGKVNIPGFGEVDVTPKGDYSVLQNKNGIFVFDKNTGKVTSAGVTPAQLNSGLDTFLDYVTKPTVKIDKDGNVVPPVPIPPPITFNEFLDNLQKAAGMTLGPEARARAQTEYDSLYNKPPEEQVVGEKDISKYSQDVQNIIKKLTTIEELKGMYGNSAAEKQKLRQIQSEITQAQTEGLIDKGALLTKEQRATVDQIAGDVRLDKDIAGFIDVRDGYERVSTGAELDNSVGDLSLIFGYMKMLDPGSVVRETEFSNAEEAIGFAQRALNLPKKFLSGDRLTTSGRQYFENAAKKLYGVKEKSYERAYDYYSNRAKRSNVDPELVLRDFTTTAE